MRKFKDVLETVPKIEQLYQIDSKQTKFVQNVMEFFQIIEQEITKVIKTGTCNEDNWNELQDKFAILINGGESKENTAPLELCTSTKEKRGRKTKKILQDVTPNIKTEKKSDIFESNKTESRDVTITKEKNADEEMPAPTELPIRLKNIKKETKSTRTTRTKTRKLAQEQRSRSDSTESDVIIQNSDIPVIEINDSFEETITVPTRTTRTKTRAQEKQASKLVSIKSERISEVPVKRSTRTRTKTKLLAEENPTEKEVIQDEAKPLKRLRSHDRSEEDQKEIKKSRSKSKVNTSDRTEYEDAISVLVEDNNENVNTTYVKDAEIGQVNQANATVIVDNPKIALNGKHLMTDDEPEDDTQNGIALSKYKKQNSKTVFSPYAKTPLKEKIEAFEKLGQQTSKIPKSRKETPKDKSKMFTPMNSRQLTKLINSTSTNRSSSKNSTSIDALLQGKSLSAIKASQAEFREREKRRQEKEAEALKKREALLQAQTEEKRRRREEKQLKAQQTREALEKEKQKQLELQRQKDERYKQQIAEKEEKLLKLKEESEKKRLEAKKKAMEIKSKAIKTDEEKQMKAMGKSSNVKSDVVERPERKIPLYMKQKPPLLPCRDCYDSDEEEYNKNKTSLASWTKGPNMRQLQLTQICVGDRIKNSYFSCEAQTPDLQEIFELIDSKKLKRTSSAIWRNPPRYTMMPNIDYFSEGSEYED